MKWDQLSSNWCPVARTLSILGDRWTILIVRDCFMGVTRFDGFQQSLGVTRHVLSDRLRRLVESGVLEKRPYQDRPVRYDYILTQRGIALGDILKAMRDWGAEHIPEDAPDSCSDESGSSAVS